MNTKYFDSILELARTRNFNRAAENLYITQPALTYQINSVEEEIGFRIFDRSGKGAILTPAGEQFVATLKDITSQLHTAIEHGQNFSAHYRDNIRISMSVRSSLYHLPEIIRSFHEEEPSISITPVYDYHDSLEPFLKGEADLLFALKEQIRHIPDIRTYDLYDSRIYLVCDCKDPLAKKKLITKDDLKGRTLMIGGGSPLPLRRLQQSILADTGISYFNSNDHDTSLTFVASGDAIVLSPGFLNDRNPQFSWIPYDTGSTLPCVLCSHSGDQRLSLQKLIGMIQERYEKETLV